MQRTSKFIGAAQPSVDIDLTADSATAPFQSRLWKTPSAMSYTKGDMAGGASKTRAWLLLPAECWDKVPSRKGTVPLLSLELNNGEAAERQLMDLAVSTAEHIAQTAGCPIPDETGTVALTEPGGSQLPRPTDPDNVCGLKGFTLPSNAVIPSRVEPGTERSTTTGAQTWACDLYLKGPGKPQISLALSQNPTVVAGVQRDTGTGTGTGSGERKVLNCQAGGMYVTVNPNEAYDDALLDEYEYAKGDKIGETRTQLLSSFATAAAAEHGCTAP
ncbi:hypothetical protein GA0115255_117025 [Streptomyces sp. Ncost-T6T-2b]|nr:hypothetical protein GA0115255_117025 [Streptomyces sp. Ncost-T6T-2b]